MRKWLVNNTSVYFFSSPGLSEHDFMKKTAREKRWSARVSRLECTRSPRPVDRGRPQCPVSYPDNNSASRLLHCFQWSPRYACYGKGVDEKVFSRNDKKILKLIGSRCEFLPAWHWWHKGGGGGGFNIRTRIGSSFVWNRACAVRTLRNKMATTVTRPCKNTRSRIFSSYRDRAERPRTCAAGCAIVIEIERIDPFAIQDGAKVERKRSTRCMVSSSTALGVDRLWLRLSPDILAWATDLLVQ